MKKKIKEKKKENTTGLAIFLVLLVIGSFALAIFLKSLTHPKNPTEISNGFIFEKKGNFWYSSVKNSELNVVYDVEFRYAPSEVKNISVEGNPNQFFRLASLNNLSSAYFTFNPNDNLTYMNLVAADIARFVNSLNGMTLVAACTANQTSACSDRPIVTCDSEKDNSLVIYVKNSEKPKISMIGNCLTIEGLGQDLLKAENKLLFIWYGII